ncbi:MAG: hypothetical protein ACLP2P_11465 [Desulfobaccales bacterium]
MKQGLIVYLMGDEPLPEHFDLLAASQSLGHPADQIELVSQDVGFPTVEEALDYLANKEGCDHIDLVLAELQERGRLRPLGPVTTVMRLA